MRRIRLAKEPDFEMGDISVAPAHRQLVRGNDQQIVIEHRVMQVLIALVNADGGIVTRDELIQSCWDGRIVGDDAINRVISRLRRTAEDLGSEVFRVETISKVGYRLVLLHGAMTNDAEQQVSPPPAEAKGTGFFAAAISDTALSTTMPRETEAAAHTWPAFVRRKANMTGLILSLMLAVGGYWLWWRHDGTLSHSMTVGLSGYRLTSPDLPTTIRESTNAEVIAAFNVDGVIGISDMSVPIAGRVATYSLGGTIYHAGDSIRVISRLSNDRSGVVLWSHGADYPADQISKVPHKVAVDASIVVRCGLSGAANHHSALPDTAMINYLQYCQEYWAYGGSKTLHYAQRVVAAVPDFSWGWSAVANGYVQLLHVERDGQRAEELRKAGLKAENKALALDRNNGEALAHKAYLIDQRNWAAQEALFKAAIAAKPLDCGCEHYGYGLKLQSVGRLHAAVDQFRAATNMLALWADSQLALANALVATGQEEEAKLSFDAAIDLSKDPNVDKWIAVSEGMETEDYTTALSALGSPELQIPPGSRVALSSAYESLASGKVEARERAVEELTKLPEEEKSSTVVRMLGALGAHHAALQAMGERPWLLWRKSMRGVLNEPSFPTVARNLGLMSYWRTSRTKPDVCRVDAPVFCRMI